LVDGADPPVEGELVDLRAAFGRLNEAEWNLAGRAAQILAWDRDHRHCGRCGSSTEPAADGERARHCSSCRLPAFPRLAPAVIALVERDDGRALLAWGRQFPGRFFSALAGFVEPGESLEDTVVREVREEVGVAVGNVRYFGSQPWPFPHSLMVGFNADYLGGEVVLQEEEIVEAGWFGPDDLPPVPRGRMSIAGWLIDDWLARRG
jgi:NAD+ diphosphatase